ncbi:SMI1/KNR4 family protein [Streptomyces collinus]|uniref:SMI1/KNR4 family protein n=1 Tax=Streptomyces collinus TaxID=42684 RepID=UPI003675030B
MHTVRAPPRAAIPGTRREVDPPCGPRWSLLFFADTGGGDLFALLSRIDRPDVFTWNHEDDSRTWVAPNLATYLEWRMTGRIDL